MKTPGTKQRTPRNGLVTLAWSIMGEVSNVVAGVVVFGLAAFTIGLAQLGQYAALVGLATILGPLCLLGRPQLAQLNAAGGTSYGESWSASSRVVVYSCFFLTCVGGAIGAYLADDASWSTAYLLVGSTLAGQCFTELAVAFHQTRQNMQRIAVVRGISAISRIGAVLPVALGENASLDTFAVATAIGWLGSVTFATASIRREFDVWPSLRPPTPSLVRNGLIYVPAAASFALLDAVDRPLLVAFGFDEAAGAYAAAFRFVSLATLPLMAAVRQTEAQFFQFGAKAAGQAVELAERLTRWASAFHLAVGGMLLLLAPILPAILGSDFDPSVPMVRVLCLLPLIRGAQIFFANSLTATGHQSDRNKALLIAMALNLGLNLALIPAIGWVGAAVATLVGETVRSIYLGYRSRSLR